MSKAPAGSRLESRMYPSLMSTKKPIKLSTVDTLKSRIKTLETTIDELYADINAKDKEIEKFEATITSQKAKIKFKLSQEYIGDAGFSPTRGQNKILNEKLRSQEILLDVRSKFIEHLLQCDRTVTALQLEKESFERRFCELECELFDKNELIDVLRAIIEEKVEKLEILSARSNDALWIAVFEIYSGENLPVDK